MDCGNGSVCVDRAQAITRCIDVMKVCDGFMDCVDNSDETNCPGIIMQPKMQLTVCPAQAITAIIMSTVMSSRISLHAVICPEDQYTCRSEGTCLNPSMRCDGYPDCVGRIPAFEDFLGVDEFEGCPPDGKCRM